MGNLLRQVAEWCVPASALRWGVLTNDWRWREDFVADLILAAILGTNRGR